MHGTTLVNNYNRLLNGMDDHFTLYQIASMGTDGRWEKLVPAFRTSEDNGQTWSEVMIVGDGLHNRSSGTQMQGNGFMTSDGTLIFAADDREGTSSLVISTDGGKSWEARGYSGDTPTDKRIAGIHANIIEIADQNGDGQKDLLALGRDGGKRFKEKLPASLSVDSGHTWVVTPTELPSISTGQRVSLIRLQHSDVKGVKPILMTGFGELQAKDTDGTLTTVNGLYAALSFDEGKSWLVEHRKIISDNSGPITIAPWQRQAELSKTTSQPGGYMSVTQTPDGIVYLTDGKIVYSFNIGWLIQ